MHTEEKSEQIFIGQGVTMGIGSDRYAGTIIDFPNFADVGEDMDGVIVTIQDDIATPADGYDYYANQVHTFAPNIIGAKTFWKKYNGVWDMVEQNPKTGRWKRQKSSMRLYIGKRAKYSDPSF